MNEAPKREVYPQGQMPGPDFIPGPTPKSVLSASPPGSCARLPPELLGSLHHPTAPCKHFSGVGHKRSAQNGLAGTPPSSPAREGPAAGRFPMRNWGTGGSAGVDPRGRRPGGLCLSVHGKGSGGGIRGGVHARGEGGSGSGTPGPDPGPRGRSAGPQRPGQQLTSPGTAPSTPSRYSGTARAAAGRCWRRGRCRRPTANRCTGCTPAPRRAG